ncbi:cell division protein ZapA [Vallitalea okinawensis]|uniref:cell division protein ZapA n=1 Tax=Vallitalea okinawensis TaxID=2078660 RepID=UPI000CFAF825|nr:cell division protein ZapA [Vallitalea okinawensis]
MNDKNKIEVLIGGKVYTLVGEESAEYMQRLALYIDNKMDELLKSEASRKLSTNLIAILTSINVADDLFKLQQEIDLLKDQLKKFELDEIKSQKSNEAYLNEITDLQNKIVQTSEKEKIYIDEAKDFKNKINELLSQLESTKEVQESEEKKFQDQIYQLQEEVNSYKEELGKMQEENLEYEKLLDECQLELIQYKNELNQYKHG